METLNRCQFIPTQSYPAPSPVISFLLGLGSGPYKGRGCFSPTCCLTLRGQTCLIKFANNPARLIYGNLHPNSTNFSHLDTRFLLIPLASVEMTSLTECLLHPRRLASATLSLIADFFFANQREDGIVRHVQGGCPPQGHVSAMYPPY